MSRCIEPKAPTAVNKALAAALLRIAQKCRSPGSCGVRHDLGRSIHRAESSSVHVPRTTKRNRIVPVIMQSDISALQVRGLTKRFDRPAVDALDLTILSGEFYALLGPNGAGKTTTLRMVAGLLRPDAGSVAVLGIDAQLAETSARDLLVSLGLEPHLGERCEGFSKGMRQKVALAGALVHEPRLIILDEPLTGLDAVSARHVKGLLGDRVRAGCTVIMTTHILEVAERMADRIGVIAAGRLVAEGTLTELRQQNGHADTSLEDLFIALVTL